MVGVRARARGGGRAALPAGEVGKGAPRQTLVMEAVEETGGEVEPTVLRLR